MTRDLQPTLPLSLELVRITPEFDQDTVPRALLRAHQVANDVWGNLVVAEGSLDFLFEDVAEQEPRNRRTVAAGATQPIPPQRPHRLIITGPVRFAVEFHRAPPLGTGPNLD